MSWISLKLHESQSKSPHQYFSVSAKAVLGSTELLLCYRVESTHSERAKLTDLHRHDRSMHHGRTDELWKKTCFEAFLPRAEGEGYFEFNGAANGDWNLYTFDHYRSELIPAFVSPGDEPKVVFYDFNKHLEVHFSIPLKTIPLISGKLGISVVLTSKDDVSYWAVHHAGAKPDFHRKESFIYDPIRD